MRIYVIFDNRAKSYGTPFFQPNDISAVRSFKTEVIRADTANVYHLYPQEFDLMWIGEFDTNTGLINDLQESETHTPPVHVCNGAQLVEARK